MNKPNESIRIDAYLARQGVAARRNIPHLLLTHRVTVAGQVVVQPGHRINPNKDDVFIDQKKVTSPHVVYYLLNKPKGIIATVSDERRRKTVVDLIKSKERIYPVGRLDSDSTGLIFLTNDGTLANHLIHPRYHVAKTYEAFIDGLVPMKKIQQLRNGVHLEDGITLPAEVKISKQFLAKTLLQITLYEGRNRQIRRMCTKLQLPLLELKRIKMGPLSLGKLKPGHYRELTPAEIKEVKKLFSSTQ